MIRAAFFDRDGTLTHGDKQKYQELYSYIRKVTGNESFEGLDDSFMEYHKRTEGIIGEYVTLDTIEKESAFWVKYYELVFRDYGHGLDEVEESKRLQRLYPQQRFKVLHPEVIEVLEHCRDKNLIMGVISDTGPSLKDSIEHLGIGKYFSRYIAGAELGVWKPNPIVFRAAIDGLGLRPEECLYVDDYDVEADGARDFGFVAFNIVRDKTKEKRDEWQIGDLRDMIKYMKTEEA